MCVSVLLCISCPSVCMCVHLCVMAACVCCDRHQENMTETEKECVCVCAYRCMCANPSASMCVCLCVCVCVVTASEAVHSLSVCLSASLGHPAVHASSVNRTDEDRVLLGYEEEIVAYVQECVCFCM